MWKYLFIWNRSVTTIILNRVSSIDFHHKLYYATFLHIFFWVILNSFGNTKLTSFLFCRSNLVVDFSNNVGGIKNNWGPEGLSISSRQTCIAVKSSSQLSNLTCVAHDPSIRMIKFHWFQASCKNGKTLTGMKICTLTVIEHASPGADLELYFWVGRIN